MRRWDNDRCWHCGPFGNYVVGRDYLRSGLRGHLGGNAVLRGDTHNHHEESTGCRAGQKEARRIGPPMRWHCVAALSRSAMCRGDPTEPPGSSGPSGKGNELLIWFFTHAQASAKSKRPRCRANHKTRETGHKVRTQTISRIP